MFLVQKREDDEKKYILIKYMFGLQRNGRDLQI